MIDFPEDYFKTEIRDGFEITSMMKRAWAGQMEVLQTIREICERHNILWFADYGTLLGAVRHKGFIPWDDDIDVFMLRDDYNKLARIAPAEIQSPYFFQNVYTDDMVWAISKIRLLQTRNL